MNQTWSRRRAVRRLRYRLKLALFRARIRIFRHRLGLALMHNVLEDRRYGGWAGGNRASSHATQGVNIFGSAHYYELRRIFTRRNSLEVQPSDVLVDVGCGKGRVVNWWLGLGLGNRIVGLEIEDELAKLTALRLRAHRNVTIVSGDALEHLPADATLVWLFNPFTRGAEGTALMTALRERLWGVHESVPSLRVVLYRPRHIEVFENDPRWCVRFLEDSGLFYRTAVVTGNTIN